MELLLISKVALAIPDELACPKLSPRSGQPEVGAPLVRMPEASVHQDDGIAGRKYQVGSTWQILVMQLVSQTSSMESLTKPDFGRRVLASDAGHHSAPHLRRHYVGHAPRLAGDGDFVRSGYQSLGHTLGYGLDDWDYDTVAELLVGLCVTDRDHEGVRKAHETSALARREASRP